MGLANTTCQHCGTPLAPHAIYCTNCGSRSTAPVDQTSADTELPHIEPTRSREEDTSYSSTPGADLSSHSSETSGQSSSLQGPATNYNVTPQPRKGPNIGMIVGGILLVVVVIGSGIFFLVKSKGSSSSSSNRSSVSATPTPMPLFADNFVDNSKGWGLASASGFSSTISNSTMILAEANHKILDMTIPAGNSVSATYNDFEVSTTLTLLKGDQNDSVGLYVRGDSNLGQGYFIDIFGDDLFDIVKIFADANKDAFLVSPTNSSAINPIGRQNKLTVVAKGPKILVLINNTLVSTINDSNGYSNGTIALFVENGQSSNGVKASFHNVIVYPAPARLPS